MRAWPIISARTRSRRHSDGGGGGGGGGGEQAGSEEKGVLEEIIGVGDRVQAANQLCPGLRRVATAARQE